MIQFVYVCDVPSSESRVSGGILQGSVLRPTQMVHVSLWKYSDDMMRKQQSVKFQLRSQTALDDLKVPLSQVS